MRMALYLFVVTVCAAVPIESGSRAPEAAEKTDNTPKDGRMPRATRSTALKEIGVSAVDGAETIEAIGERLPLGLAVAENRSDLMLYDGRIFKAALIVVVGETSVAVDHAEGWSDVPVERVPLAVLARARAEIAAMAAEKRKLEAEAMARVAEANREGDTKRAAELQERFALTNARIDALGREQIAIPRRPAIGPAQRLVALQEKFPARRKDKNALGIEFDLPPRQVWAFYNSAFQTATMETLPETLALMEARLAQDIASWEWKSNSTLSVAQSVEHVQAERTALWLAQTLRGFLDDARRLTR